MGAAQGPIPTTMEGMQEQIRQIKAALMKVSPLGQLSMAAHLFMATGCGAVLFSAYYPCPTWQAGRRLNSFLQLLALFPAYLLPFHAVVGLVIWHIEWHTGLPFNIAAMSAFYSPLLTLLCIVGLLHLGVPTSPSSPSTPAAAALLAAQNELVNWCTRCVLDIVTRTKVSAILAVFPGRLGLLALLALVLGITSRKLRWASPERSVYSAAWGLMVGYELLSETAAVFVSGVHVLAAALYALLVVEFARGLCSKAQSWRMPVALSLLLFVLWRRAPERQLLLLVVNLQYVSFLIPLSRYITRIPRLSSYSHTLVLEHRSRRDGFPVSDILKHLVVMLLLNQALHDYGQAFGFNFKPDVDPFSAVGISNFNQSPICAALLMAFSKTGVFYLSTVYLYLAQEASLLPLLVIILSVAMDGIVLHEMAWRYMMSSRLIDVALHVVAVSTMGLLYVALILFSSGPGKTASEAGKAQSTTLITVKEFDV